MHRPTHILLAALVAAVLLGAPAASAARDGPRFSEDDDKFVLENDHVTVWFQGKKPLLKVFPTATALGNASDAAAFEYRFAEVVEFRDVDGDGAPSETEVVSRLDLHGAGGWTVERTETAEMATLNLTLREAVKLGRGPLRDANLSVAERVAEVSLVFHLRAAAVELDANGTLLELPASAVKYDFVVAEWPWLDAQAHRLALVTGVSAAMDADLDAAVPYATVETNATQLGYVSWLANATATGEAGETFDVPVEPFLEVGVNETRITYVYDAAGIATLVHDPAIGVTTADGLVPGGAQAPAVRTVPGPTTLVAVAAIGLALVAARRR